MFEKSYCQTFMVIAKTTVIITVWTWCCPKFHDILLCAERLWTSDWRQPASSFCPGFCTQLTCCCTTLQVKCLYFSMLNLI